MCGVGKERNRGREFDGSVIVDRDLVFIEAAVRGRGNDLHIGERAGENCLARIVVIDRELHDVAVFEFAGKTAREGLDRDADRLFGTVECAEHVIRAVGHRGDLAREQIVALLQIHGGELTEDVFFLCDYIGWEVVRTNRHDFDIGIGNHVSLHYVTRESYDVGPVVGKLVDEGRDGKRDNECKDDTDDSDDSSVFHSVFPPIIS